MNIYTVFRAFDDNYKNHQMLKEIFPGSGKLLFQKNGSRLLVETDIVIDKRFSDSFDVEIMAESEGVLESLPEVVMFSIRLNAVKANGRKRFPVLRTNLSNWVSDKLSNIGAEIYSMKIIDEGMLVSYRQEVPCYHSSALVIGTLNIINVDEFAKVVHQGIGHGKAFGFGLMNVFL